MSSGFLCEYSWQEEFFVCFCELYKWRRWGWLFKNPFALVWTFLIITGLVVCCSVKLNTERWKHITHRCLSHYRSFSPTLTSSCLLTATPTTHFPHLLVTVYYAASLEETGGTWQIGDKNISVCVCACVGRKGGGREGAKAVVSGFNLIWTAAINRQREKKVERHKVIERERREKIGLFTSDVCVIK